MGIKTRFFIAFCIIIVLIGSGLALLSNTTRLRQPAYAAPSLPDSDLSVVGPPSLPAATVDSIFARMGSPMVGTGALVEQTSRQVNIDDAFALAVWWTETSDGAAGVGLAYRNPGSVRGSIGYPSAYSGYTVYPRYADAVVYWFHMLKNIYIGHGLTTVYAISHPYVGTSTSYLWAGKVVALMLRYRGEAPLPSPTPTVSSNVQAHNRHIIRPANTGDTATQSSAPPASGQQAVLHAALAFQPATPQTATALSATATWLIAICALLLALAIVVCVHLLPTGLPASSQRAHSNNLPAGPSFTAPATHALYPPPAFSLPIFRLASRPLNEPQTDALVGTPFIASDPATCSTLASPSAFLPTTSKLRRTRLSPDLPTTDQLQEVPVPTGVRPTGLLARYGTPQ
jgi:hypothetical protein